MDVRTIAPYFIKTQFCEFGKELTVNVGENVKIRVGWRVFENCNCEVLWGRFSNRRALHHRFVSNSFFKGIVWTVRQLVSTFDKSWPPKASQESGFDS